MELSFNPIDRIRKIHNEFAKIIIGTSHSLIES